MEDRQKWENNIKCILNMIGGYGLESVAEDREKWWTVVSTNEPLGFIKYGEFVE